jgi:Cys-tRNA(Pro)/Cys-tRNA(Cys) deacylase
MTPAIDKAKQLNLAFSIHQYTHNNTASAYGQEAADKLGIEYDRVFKTLVVSSSNGEMAVAVIPVSRVEHEASCQSNWMEKSSNGRQTRGYSVDGLRAWWC